MNADLREHLKNLSPAKRARILQALREEAARHGTFDAIPKRPRQERARLSFAQQRLWFIHQLAPDITAYNFLLAVRLKGQLNVRALEQSINRIISRHETLRTSFALSDGEPLQQIAEEFRLSLPVEDLRQQPEESRPGMLQRLMLGLADQPFDLSRGPLLRVRLLRTAEDEHVAVMVLHHIIADGWSLGVLMREVGQFYSGYAGGLEPEADELRVQYGDYAEWQREWLRGEALEEQLRYWRERLQGMTALQMPTDRVRPAVQSFRGAAYTFALSPELAAALRALNKREGVTMFMTLLAVLQTLCYRYTGQEDIVVSSGISTRNHPDTEALIGCFINILLMRSDLSGNPGFVELLGRVRQVAMEAYAHQDLPFELLVEALRPERDLSYNPLSQVMLVLHNAPVEAMKLKDLLIEPVEAERETAQLDLNLQLWERADRLTGLLEYDTDLFERSTIVRMVEHFRSLLEAITHNPAQRLSELSLLTGAERHQLLVELNETQATFPAHLCLHQLFEMQAQSSPGALAVIAEDSSLTYEELNQRANRLAHGLRVLGVCPGRSVAICVERSVEMVVGLVGTLKAGGAIVPLDPAYPKERLAFMLKDAEVTVLLSQRHLADRLPEHEAKTIYLDEGASVGAQESVPNLRSGVTPDDLAYVIYTSGSTGLPKAVMLDHRGRVNNFFDFNRRFRTGASDRLIALSSLSFDMTAYDVFGTLASGAGLVIPCASKERDPSHWADLMRRHGVTIWHSAPALAEMLVDQLCGRPENAPGSLRLVLLGGDWIPLSLPDQLKKLFAGVRVISLGGATEASMDSIIYPVEESDPAWRSIPYGRPMANQTSYILDKHLQPVPVGVPGELHLGGTGLAWGYRNRPGLSAEKFIPHPFGDRAGARLYKTGDLARYMPDGQIELLGRIDQQVKLRGLRIELGEIVAALRQHPSIKEAVALVREDKGGNRHLVAYLVHEQEPLPTSGELRDFLKRSLPDYMVPSFFVALDALPLTPNGKVDRRGLPAPDTTRREVDKEFIAPVTAVEETVAGVWAAVLHLERVSVNDNFFDLGGHSLLATQIISRLQSSFAVELPLRHIFETPTVGGLARSLEAIISATQADALKDEGTNISRPHTIPRRSVATPLPLSFAQQRLWFLEQLAPGTAAYNIPLAASLKGELNVPALEQSINRIISRHETLRTSFTISESGRPQQEVASELRLTVPVVELRQEPAENRQQIANRLILELLHEPFDLSRAPLLRVRLLRLADQEHVAVMVLHHIIADGWSLGVLMREVGQFYSGYAGGLEPEADELRVQYGDYAEWQRGWMREEVIGKEVRYWGERLRGMTALQMPTDRMRPAVQSFRGAAQVWKLPFAETERLNALCQREGVTMFMTLTAAFQILLHYLTGQVDVVVGTDIANRNHRQIEGLIGFFVNQLVLRLDLSGDPTLRELLARARKVTLEAYAHQDVPFEMLVAELQPERELNRTPMFQVKLVLQNYPLDSLELPGLTLTPIPVPVQTSKYDLLFNIYETGQGLAATLEYDTDLFEAASISRFLSLYEAVLRQATLDPDVRLKMLVERLVQADEQQRAVTEEHLAQVSVRKLREIKRRPVTGEGDDR